jgi:hypothetical protein
MHATVVVLAANNTPSTSPSTSSSQGSPGNGASNNPASAQQTPAQTVGGGSLPLTGVNVLAVVATGLMLIAAGVLLRRALRGEGEGGDTADPEPS